MKIFKLLKLILSTLTEKLNRLGEHIKYGRKIRTLMKGSPQQPLIRQQKKEIRDFYSALGFSGTRTYWHEFYGGLYGTYSKNYIPQDLFYSIIEYSLNRKEYFALQDKNILNRVFSGIKTPKEVVKNINGFYSLNDLIISKEHAIASIKRYSNLIIKPSLDTGGGKGVVKFSLSGDQTDLDNKSIDELLDSYGKDFIVQEVLEQSKAMSKLNESSINTIKISTFLWESEIRVLAASVRFGREGEIADNMSLGGIGCGINPDGSLKKKAYNSKYNLITDAIILAKIDGFVVPSFEKVKETVKRIHQQIPFFKVVSWDIALDANDDPVLVEYNVFGQGIDFQALNGPFFGDSTEGVLKMAAQYKKTL